MTCLSPCWDCLKGRHLICTGWDNDDRARCDCPHTTLGDEIELQWDRTHERYEVLK